MKITMMAATMLAGLLGAASGQNVQLGDVQGVLKFARANANKDMAAVSAKAVVPTLGEPLPGLVRSANAPTQSASDILEKLYNEAQEPAQVLDFDDVHAGQSDQRCLAVAKGGS